MARRFHPSGVKFGDVRGITDIFGDHGEMSAGVKETARESGLARILMRDNTNAGHEHGVIACGPGEILVPLQRGEMARGAFAVCRVEEDALIAARAIGASLCGKRRRKGGGAAEQKRRESQSSIHTC